MCWHCLLLKGMHTWVAPQIPHQPSALMSFSSSVMNYVSFDDIWNMPLILPTSRKGSSPLKAWPSAFQTINLLMYVKSTYLRWFGSILSSLMPSSRSAKLLFWWVTKKRIKLTREATLNKFEAHYSNLEMTYFNLSKKERLSKFLRSDQFDI